MGESQVCGLTAARSPATIPWWSSSPHYALVVQYSFSLTTFSPSGKLVQIEYALNAVSAGTTSLGIKATNGVVIATEKKLRSSLVDENTVQRISTLTPNIGVAYSGMGPDSRVLVRKARKQAQAYYQLYKEQIPVAQLCREVATVMQEFTRKFVCSQVYPTVLWVFAIVIANMRNVPCCRVWWCATIWRVFALGWV